MPVDARNRTTDVDRLDDRKSLPRPALFTRPRTSPQSTHSVRPHPRVSRATAVDEVNDWYSRLGASHRQRDDLARLTARAIEERSTAQRLACHHRWPAIVNAMRTVIGHYNDGAQADVVSLHDRPTGEGGDPAATVATRSGRSLVIVVEDADLWVRASLDDNGNTHAERWIGMHRTDEATARYVLQNWLAQLEPADSAIRVPPAAGSAGVLS
jgi:hypothetical protein